MNTSKFTRFFPTPSYLSMPAAGLDISDQSIKWVTLSDAGRAPKVSGWGEASIPVGLLEAGKIRSQADLANILRELKKSIKLEYVTASLPEEQTFLFRLRLPAMSEAELRDSVEFQLEEHIPLKPTETVFDFEVVSRPSRTQDHFEVSVSAMPRVMLEEYIDVIRTAGLEVKGLEIEGHSLARALLKRGDPSTVMIVDIGKVRTGFSVISGGILLYTSTIEKIGGEDITISIQKNLGLTRDQAEELKVAKGVANMTGDRDLFFALVPILSTIKDEISRVHTYWQEHADDDGLPRPAIEAVVLSGGQASLPGLIDYMRGNLPVPVSVGNPWINVGEPGSLPPIEYQQSLRFATAIGLALRNFES